MTSVRSYYDPYPARRSTKQQRAMADLHEAHKDQVFDEVELAKLMVDGVLALGTHSMQGLRDLDDERRELAGTDAGQNFLLAEIEAAAKRKIQKINNNLYEPRRR
jgi:hypothetical protein